MSLPVGAGYDTAIPQAPSGDVDGFTYIWDESAHSVDWWNDVNTSDGTRGRVALNIDATELASDPIDFDDIGQTGLRRVYIGTVLAASSDASREIRSYAPNTRNTAYGVSDTYGQYNAYDSNWFAYYPNGGIVDRTSNQRNGIAEGGVISGGVTGKIGDATEFNGSGDAVNLGNSFLDGIDDLQISSIFLSDALASERSIFSCWDGGLQSENQWLMETSGTNLLLALRNSNQEQDVINAPSGLSINIWYQIVSIYERNQNAKIMLNDVQTGSSASLTDFPLLSSPLDLKIGSNSNGTKDFDGKIQQVSVQNLRSDSHNSQEYSQTNDNSTFWGTWTWNAAGGTVFNVTCSDGITVSDSLDAQAVIAALLTDGINASDATPSSLQFNVNAADSMALADSIAALANISATLSELATFTDFSTTAKAPIEVICNDTISMSDLSAGHVEFNVTCPDGVNLSDFSQAVAIIAASALDGITLNDIAIETSFIPQGRVTITGSSAKLSMIGESKRFNITFNVVAKPHITGGNA